MASNNCAVVITEMKIFVIVPLCSRKYIQVHVLFLLCGLFHDFQCHSYGQGLVMLLKLCCHLSSM